MITSLLKVMPRIMVKAEIARTSSTLAAAITNVGIPLSTRTKVTLIGRGLWKKIGF